MINLRRLVIYAVAVGPVESLSPFFFLFLVGDTSRSGHRVSSRRFVSRNTIWNVSKNYMYYFYMTLLFIVIIYFNTAQQGALRSLPFPVRARRLFLRWYSCLYIPVIKLYIYNYCFILFIYFCLTIICSIWMYFSSDYHLSLHEPAGGVWTLSPPRAPGNAVRARGYDTRQKNNFAWHLLVYWMCIFCT